MKTAELKAMTEDQLKDTLVNLKKEAFNLRFQAANGELEKTHRIRQVRRTVAKINTLLQQQKNNKGDK